MGSLTPSANVADMNLKITHIECHRESLVIMFQGQYKAGCELDYYILQNEIQRVSKVKDNVYVGGSCLVEDTEGKWHRGRVLEKRENICEAFLIDTGQVLVVEETHLASACDEFFQLPPKVVLGVFASILPLGEKWDPKAINYFSSLVGLQIAGHVKAVLPYQLFILQVPKVIDDVLELKLGKFIDGDSFCLIVEMLRAFPKEMLCKRVPQLLQQRYSFKQLLTFINSEKRTDFWPDPGDLFPRLPVGSKENVKITVAVSPNKFYCQIQKWQKELEDLTGAMHLYYEAISTENNKSFDSLGLLCAAKRQNGQWHRGVIKQLLSDHVEVWFMDFGDIEAVPSSCVQKLKVEFMALPVISFPCALSCLGSQDETVIKIQLKELIRALIGQTSVCVCVDLFNDSKYLYYVTLQNQNIEIHAKHPENLNEAAASCVSLSETKITSVAVNYKPCHERYNSFKNCTVNKHTKNCLPEWDISLPSHCKKTEMQVNSFHTALVVYVINPSNFWIQTCEYENEFQALMKNIAAAYDRCGADEMVLKNPEPGLLCCARYSKDMLFYRGVVIEVLCGNITVYFLDFGNTDTVPCCDVKTLLPEFSDLPALAMCCALACTFSVDDMWVKNEIDFFKGIVFNRPLLLHVIGKQNKKYIVNAQYKNGLQQQNVATCMVQAGYAQYWEKPPDSVLNLAKKSQAWNPHKLKKKVNAQSKCAISERSKPVCEKKIFYKEFVFKPGAVFEVVCSSFVSPADFSCQLQSKLPELNTLMEQIQNYYKEHTNPYKTGQVACVVKCPKDGKWYRATVVQQVSTNEVDVVFVDYGYRERGLLKDLQAVLPDFLTLESQAFRCGLKNVPLQTDSLNWSEEVHRHFEDFISASRGPLTCIIYALVLVSPHCLCNIVDLQTPFSTAEEFLREHGLTQPEYIGLRNLASLGSLYSFCYSSFNIKVGSEEEVYITHIRSPSKFYCQLNRNTETIEALMKEVSVLSTMSNKAKYNASTTRLCIARYFEDGLFYRALAFPVESTSYVCADFVDFGNMSMVERGQLIPIPDSATDLIFTPMQAIKCYLSDLRERKIPAQVTRWFEETFLGKLLKAVIVSRESNGQIVTELYDGQLKVSQKVKEKVNSEVAGYISHMNSLSSFYVQLAEDTNSIIKLEKELNESMVNIGHENCLHELMVGDLIVAEDSIDCFYYRAVIKALKSENSFEVEFIDYGNVAVVSLSKICSIQKKFLILPRLSVHCFLSRVKSIPDDSRLNRNTSYFLSKINNKPFACKFLKQHGERWEIDVICDGKSMSDHFLPKKGRRRWQNTSRHNRENRPKQILVPNGNPQNRKSGNGLGSQSKTKAVRMKNTSKTLLNVLPQDVNSGQVERAKVVNISESGEFHVQLCRNLQILHELNVMLVKEAQRGDFLRVDDIEEGLECMAKLERNSKWYRSKVIKKFVREKLMLVFFMDYGTCEMVSLNYAKMLSDKIKRVPKQAVFCKWVWFKKLKKMEFVHVVNALLDCGIMILFLRYLESSHIWEVDILVEEILLQEYLNQLLSHCQTVVGPEKSGNTDGEEFDKSFKINSITWTLLQTGRKCPGFATVVTDPSNFCIQFEVLLDCMNNLSLLFSDLPDNLPALPKELVAPGTSCLIKFGLEAEWNRAEISQVTSQFVVLTFIDYGFLKNIPYSDIHKLKVIPESLSVLPRLAQSCSLHDIVPAKGKCWSDKAKLLFQKLLSKPGLIFHFKHYGSEMKLEVDVLCEQNNVAHALIAAGHAVFSGNKCCVVPADRIKSEEKDLQPKCPDSS
ncbi:PREDICTED: tudor domain-containing protein 15-like [Pterocles gutturalis]|uniref:tudor domain-containing protein 15-like n=1 Tax=Pterocles gutturalis TaxID=240206 RepID=UPI00052888B3|nr:PREDICTED: tudor domain-containing protein 15-like [Pterocles gutturalis]